MRVCLSCHRKFSGGETECPIDRVPLHTPDSDPLAGTDLAEHYEVLDLIGSGGWSLVYQARQRSLGRLVAIKIMHAHLVLDPEKVTRFKREAEATSKFNHPAIPAVYDFGVLASGQPYMVMGYVAGKSLADTLSEQGALPIEKALDVFIQCASALALAHEGGVIHRDIKPGNILLTSDAEEVKILDFGLAKLLAPEEGSAGHATLTQAGHTIGTPAYMSPEQCLGLKLDARSDLYSLGCVMYECLTGIRLFEGKDAFDSMNRHMRPDVSFDGTANQASIPEELQACVLKTLAKNPADRYENAQQLMNALIAVQQHCLRGRKKIALPMTRWLTLARRRLLSQSASIGFAATSLTITGLIAVVCIALVWKWLMPGVGEHRPQGNASELYTQYISRADALLDSDNFRQAIVNLKLALEQAENFGSTDPRLIETLQKLQRAYEKSGKSEDAARVAAKIERIRSTTYGAMYGNVKDNAGKITQLSARLLNDPSDKRTAEELAAELNDQAALFLTQSNVEDADNLLTQALGIEKRLLGTSNPEYARSLSNIACVYARKGQTIKAEGAYKQALDIRQKALGPDHPLVGRSLRNLGDFYFEANRYSEAEPLLERSLAIFRQAGTPELANYAWTLNNLALLHASQKHTAEARQELLEALSVRKQLYGNDGLDVGRTENNMAQLDQMVHQYHDAEKEYWSALRIYDKQLGPEEEDTIKCVFGLATMYFESGNLTDAEPLFKRVMNVLERTNPHDRRLISAYEHLSAIYQHQGRSDDLKDLQQRMSKP